MSGNYQVKDFPCVDYPNEKPKQNEDIIYKK